MRGRVDCLEVPYQFTFPLRTSAGSTVVLSNIQEVYSSKLLVNLLDSDRTQPYHSFKMRTPCLICRTANSILHYHGTFLQCHRQLTQLPPHAPNTLTGSHHFLLNYFDNNKKILQAGGDEKQLFVTQP